jgi:hypothetical protein
LINNRQGGRRRGRGGQRGQNLGGQPGGNRQDNRQRGNAAQLLEKYKSMARDAQLAGDRVQTEYFLQYADHYFRVLSENRARFEDQNQQRRHRDDEFDGDEGDEEMVETDEASAEEQPERAERQDRGERFGRRNRPRRDDRGERESRDSSEGDGSGPNGGAETIPFDVLPPAIGRDESETVEPAAEEPRRPRRRSRTPRSAEGEEEIAPAA